jgi:hypothetical protein
MQFKGSLIMSTNLLPVGPTYRFKHLEYVVKYIGPFVVHINVAFISNRSFVVVEINSLDFSTHGKILHGLLHGFVPITYCFGLPSFGNFAWHYLFFRFGG